ncbi:hypothetical protein ACWIUA_12020, partial [Ursidibacter sp. B-7004-1]
MMKFLSENSHLYQEYHLFLKYFKKSYLDMVFLNLNVIFDKGSIPNIFSVNTYISSQNEFAKKLNFETEFEHISFKLKKIRNKAIAHIDDININNIYQEFNISKQDLDNIIYYTDKRLECLIKFSQLEFVKNEIIYLEGEGIEAILKLLPKDNPYKHTAKGIRLEKQFGCISELVT